MQLIFALLLYVLGSAAVISFGSIFGVAINFLQALSFWIIVSFLVSIIKNF